MPSSLTSAPSAEPAPFPVPPGRREAFERIWSDPRGILGALRTINNVPIAHRYMVTAFAFFLDRGRAWGSSCGSSSVRPREHVPGRRQRYNQIFTMHGTTMMFLFVIPFIEALTNVRAPAPCSGRGTCRFPRLTALTLLDLFVRGRLPLFELPLRVSPPTADGSPTCPSRARRSPPGLGMDFWDIGPERGRGGGASRAAAEMITGVLRMRAPGMTLTRLPLFAWSMLVTACDDHLRLHPADRRHSMLELDRKLLRGSLIPGGREAPPLAAPLLDVRPP